MEASKVVLFASSLLVTSAMISEASAQATLTYSGDNSNMPYSVGSTVTPAWKYQVAGNAPPDQPETYECCNPVDATFQTKVVDGQETQVQVKGCFVQITGPAGISDQAPPDHATKTAVTGAPYTFTVAGQYNVSLSYICYWVAYIQPTQEFPNGQRNPSFDTEGTIPPVLFVVVPAN
jgi:hypothetical protein